MRLLTRCGSGGGAFTGTVFFGTLPCPSSAASPESRSPCLSRWPSSASPEGERDDHAEERAACAYDRCGDDRCPPVSGVAPTVLEVAPALGRSVVTVLVVKDHPMAFKPEEVDVAHLVEGAAPGGFRVFLELGEAFEGAFEFAWQEFQGVPLTGRNATEEVQMAGKKTQNAPRVRQHAGAVVTERRKDDGDGF